MAQASVKTWRAIVAGRGPSESVTGYLLLAVQNEARRVNAGHRAVSSVEDEYLTGLVDEREERASEAREEHDLLDRAFRSLPTDWQRVLGLTIVEERTLSRAAAALGISVSATTSLAHRAREGLRVAYLQQYVDHAAPGCEEAASELGRYARGTLNATARARVDRHIATCADCTRQLDRLARMNTSLRAWLGPVVVGTGVGAGAYLGWGSGAVEAALLLLTRPALLMGVAAAVILGLIAVITTVLTPIPRPFAGAQPTPSTSISATIMTEPTASTGVAPTAASTSDPQPTPSAPRATLAPEPAPSSTPGPTDTQPRPPRRTADPTAGPSASAPVTPPTSGPTTGPAPTLTPSVPGPTPTPSSPREDDTTEFWISIER